MRFGQAFAAIAAVLAMASASAMEAPKTIGVHLASVHQRAGFNNINPGVYAVWANGLTVGTYRNSNSRQSAYVGMTWERGPFAVSAVLLTGYESAAIKPGVIPSMAVNLGHSTKARASLLLDPSKGPAVHFSIERSF